MMASIFSRQRRGCAQWPRSAARAGELRKFATFACICGLVLAMRCEAQNQPAQNPPDDAPVIQLNVNRILIPVVVRDASGRVIGDLKHEDFEVFDNDKPHAISGMSVEGNPSVAATTAPNAVTVPAPDVPPDARPNVAHATPPAAKQRFIVLLFDDLHMTNEILAQAKIAAGKALSTLLTGKDIGAVISLSQKTNSGLTRDRARLQDALNSLRVHAAFQISAGECPPIGYYQADMIENKHDSAAFQDAVSKVFNCDPGLDPQRDGLVAQNEAHATARNILNLGQQDAQTTYNSISAFVRGMARLPGERIMVLVSPGFLRLDPHALTEESQLVNLAAENDVRISALDARGLYTTNIAANEQGPTTGGPSFALNLDYRLSGLTQAEDPLSELAYGTGGSFVHNSNDLSGGLTSLAQTAETVYVLELAADGPEKDGGFHRLSVKVHRSGVQVQARKGYFVPLPEKKRKERKSKAGM